MNEQKALYGTIPFCGGQYTVSFEKTKGLNKSSCHCSGYGDFPFEKYPNIPVIDYRNNDSVMDVLKWNVYVEESTIICTEDSARYIPLKNFLARVYDLGITIHNYER